jgi:chorismate mutase
MLRGVRGATTVSKDDEQEIFTAVEKLLTEMIAANDINPEKVASVFISVTDDIRAAFPAKPLREFAGWTYVPVVCMQEIPVQNSLPLCIRVMLHLNTDQSQQEIIHIYQGNATVLRPDLKN